MKINRMNIPGFHMPRSRAIEAPKPKNSEHIRTPSFDTDSVNSTEEMGNDVLLMGDKYKNMYKSDPFLKVFHDTIIAATNALKTPKLATYLFPDQTPYLTRLAWNIIDNRQKG